LASSRFGPTVPVAPASLRVWQADAAGAREDGLARGRIALERQGGQGAGCPSSWPAGVPTTVVRGGGRLGAVEAAGAEQAERKGASKTRPTTEDRRITVGV